MIPDQYSVFMLKVIVNHTHTHTGTESNEEDSSHMVEATSQADCRQGNNN